jgi:lipid A 4'-phosphatase
VGRALLLGVFIAWLAGRLGWRRVSPARQAAAGVALCTALLGPGLLIEGVFKPELQRPRPVQTADFGGAQPYHPPLRPCWACASHHSFVSSHAAAGFWLMSWGLLASPAWRRRWFAIGLLAGAVIGWGRMLQGGHYLGDVVFSFFTVWVSGMVVLAAWRWRLARQAAAGGPAR